MLRTDGEYTVYVIEVLLAVQPGNPKWALANFDVLGTPQGFSSSDECWRWTGEHGTFSRSQAIAGLQWIARRNPGERFRLVRVMIEQNTEVEAEAYIRATGNAMKEAEALR